MRAQILPIAIIYLKKINSLQGVTFPAMYALWGKWAPPGERSRLVTISIAGERHISFNLVSFPYIIMYSLISGVYFGNLASFPLSALLCQYGFDGGWPSVFYVFGMSTNIEKYVITLHM